MSARGFITDLKFENDKQGLSDPFPDERDSSGAPTSHFRNQIENFKSCLRTPNQPSFYIKRESWELLMEGKISKTEQSWLPENYEVYAFVFCIAQTDFYQSPLTNWPTAAIRGLGNERYAYFRIRTIIKYKEDEIKKPARKREATADRNLPGLLRPKPPIDLDQIHIIAPYVITEHLAYVDREQAVLNGENGIGDCLRFCSEGSIKWTEIQNDVKSWINNVGKSESILRVHSNGKIMKITQEGTVFGKERIQKILNENSQAKGIKISFALKKAEEIEQTMEGRINPIQFVFKINPEYVTELPCPIPIVC